MSGLIVKKTGLLMGGLPSVIEGKGLLVLSMFQTFNEVLKDPSGAYILYRWLDEKPRIRYGIFSKV